MNPKNGLTCQDLFLKQSAFLARDLATFATQTRADASVLHKLKVPNAKVVCQGRGIITLIQDAR